jgi:hypothetical protein
MTAGFDIRPATTTDVPCYRRTDYSERHGYELLDKELD